MGDFNQVWKEQMGQCCGEEKSSPSVEGIQPAPYKANTCNSLENIVLESNILTSKPNSVKITGRVHQDPASFIHLELCQHMLLRQFGAT